MPRYMVERDILGAGGWSAEQMRRMAQKSRAVLRGMAPDIQWATSDVTGDEPYCLCIAPSPSQIRERVARRGWPCDRVSPVHAVMDPTAAER